MKCCSICIIVVVYLVMTAVGGGGAVNECGKRSSSLDVEAAKLAPCQKAAHDIDSVPSKTCCNQIKKMGLNPPCLCAVMLSDTAASFGVKPAVAVTIPKRCELVDRPIGYKCGAYTMP